MVADMDLLIHQGALGDWVLTFEVLRALGPRPVGAVTSASKAALAARLLPHVRAIDIEGAGWSALHAPRTTSAGHDGDPADEVDRAVVARLREAGRIISFVSSGEDAWAERVRRLAPGARLYTVDPRPPADWPGHVADWYTHELRRQGVELPAAILLQRPPRRIDGPIVIHPGSGGAAKCWPVERFEAVIASLRARRREVLPVLGEVELDRWPKEQTRRWIDDLGAKPLPSLDALADALETAAAFLGNDSGPVHLAAQMGLPTVALFGPTSPRLWSPRLWSPRGPSVTVLAPASPRGMDWLDVAPVLEAVERAPGHGRPSAGRV
ncbi:MAG: glycosyltransferase family 9 protein [Planctomycetota bacterium]|nr:glycosyltransferase family 9 protein [Planctomycetota bacterium]